MIILSLLGPVVFGVILLVAANRVTLRGGMALLLLPLVLFLLITLIEILVGARLRALPQSATRVDDVLAAGADCHRPMEDSGRGDRPGKASPRGTEAG